MKPPRNAPATPRASDTSHPPGSLPGTITRASAPTTRPKIKNKMRFMSPPESPGPQLYWVGSSLPASQHPSCHGSCMPGAQHATKARADRRPSGLAPNLTAALVPLALGSDVGMNEPVARLIVLTDAPLPACLHDGFLHL